MKHSDRRCFSLDSTIVDPMPGSAFPGQPAFFHWSSLGIALQSACSGVGHWLGKGHQC